MIEQRKAYTVGEFCDAHRISRTRLYALWLEGCGPRFLKNGVRRIITEEAAADWRRDMEAASRNLWIEEEVDAFIAQKKAERDGKAA
jgi:hypothetical protein